MKTLTSIKAHNAGQLHRELINGIANFRRFRTRDDGIDEGLFDTGRSYSSDNTITIVYADDIDDAAVQAIVDAHTPA